MNQRYWWGLLVAAVLLRVGFAFVQYYQLPLDGDLPAIAAPSPGYAVVLHDPFGWAALTQHVRYAAPNRFFAHAGLYLYLNYVPGWLQAVAAPIDSVYLAGALLRTLTYGLLLTLLATYARLAAGGSWRRRHWWGAVALLMPLFQTGGFNGQMGIVNRSLTYSFFYDFPLALLLLWLLPFYRALCQGQPPRLSWPRALALLGLLVVLAFNGPVVPATAAVLGGLLATHAAWRRWGPGAARPAGPRWPGLALGLLALLALLCAYSLYIGRFNSESSQTLSLGQRYALIPAGVWSMLGYKLGLPLLLALVLLNAGLVRRFTADTAEGQRVATVLRWVGWFALVYILLLPLGGYRSYREYLLRNDSVLPCLLGLLLAYALSTLHLLRQLPAPPRRWYLAALGLVLLVFLNADRRLWLRENNACERRALAQLARATTPVVELPADCPVVDWALRTVPQRSAETAEMVYRWNITRRPVLFYQVPPAGAK